MSPAWLGEGWVLDTETMITTAPNGEQASIEFLMSLTSGALHLFTSTDWENYLSAWHGEALATLGSPTEAITTPPLWTSRDPRMPPPNPRPQGNNQRRGRGLCVERQNQARCSYGCPCRATREGR